MCVWVFVWKHTDNFHVNFFFLNSLTFLEFMCDVFSISYFISLLDLANATNLKLQQSFSCACGIYIIHSSGDICFITFLSPWQCALFAHFVWISQHTTYTHTDTQYKTGDFFSLSRLLSSGREVVSVDVLQPLNCCVWKRNGFAFLFFSLFFFFVVCSIQWAYKHILHSRICIWNDSPLLFNTDFFSLASCSFIFFFRVLEVGHV